MTGDCHVRFCEGLGVKFPRATHPYSVYLRRRGSVQRVLSLIPLTTNDILAQLFGHSYLLDRHVSLRDEG